MPHCSILCKELELRNYLISNILSNVYDFCMNKIDFTKIFAPLRQMVIKWWPYFITNFSNESPCSKLQGIKAV